MSFLVKILLVAALLGSGLGARAELVDAIQAVVGESVITYQQIHSSLMRYEETLQMQYRTKPQEYQKHKMQLVNSITESMVNDKMIIHEFSTAGFKIPESIIDDYVQEKIHDIFHGDRVEMTKQLQREGLSFEDFKQRLHDDFIVGQMTLKFRPEPIISPLKVETYYAAHKDEFKVEDEVKLRMIVLNRPADDTTDTVRKRMEEILSQIKDGASFADLAKSYSDGSQRAEGGETGWQEMSKLNKVLLEPINKLKPGEYSGVIESPEAYFLVLLEERHAAHVRPLTELREDIEKTLLVQERNRLQQRWMHRLRAKTFIQTF